MLQKTFCSNCHFTKNSSTIEAFNWRDHKRRNPIMFLHFIQSMLLAYIDSIEPLVASAHPQMQMKQANFFYFFLQFVLLYFGKNMCRPVLLCYRCCYAPTRWFTDRFIFVGNWWFPVSTTKRSCRNSFYVATVHRFDPVLSHKFSWFLVINDFIVDTFMFHFQSYF